jgi:hypothetical protein
MNRIEAVVLAKGLQRRPWLEETFPIAFLSMIFPGRQQLLYHLGRRVYRGVGNVVDLGALLGSAVVCLAAGHKDSGKLSLRKLHSFHMFFCPSEGFSRTPIKSGKKLGDCTLDIYHKPVGSLINGVQVYEGDIIRMAKQGGRGAILFVDGAKTRDVNEAETVDIVPNPDLVQRFCRNGLDAACPAGIAVQLGEYGYASSRGTGVDLAHAFAIIVAYKKDGNPDLTATYENNGKAIPVNESPRRAGDAVKVYTHVPKLTRKLGWRTRFTNIGTIAQTEWNLQYLAWSVG